MKTIKNIILAIVISSAMVSCSFDETMEEPIVYATGDDADDPAEPDEENMATVKVIAFPIQATGDDADDPAEPDDVD
jgi:hypothetical protein